MGCKCDKFLLATAFDQDTSYARTWQAILNCPRPTGKVKLASVHRICWSETGSFLTRYEWFNSMAALQALLIDNHIQTDPMNKGTGR